MCRFFLPTSRKVLPTFQTFCSVGIHFAQTVLHFAHFQNQATKRCVLGWVLRCFVYLHISERGLLRLSKEQGLEEVFWAKWDPIWAKWDPSGQFVLKVGKSPLELGGKFNHTTNPSFSKQISLNGIMKIPSPKLIPDALWFARNLEIPRSRVQAGFWSLWNVSNV